MHHRTGHIPQIPQTLPWLLIQTARPHKFASRATLEAPRNSIQVHLIIHTHKGNYCSLVYIVMAGCVPFLAAGQTLPLQSRVARSHSKVAVHVPFTSQRLPTYGGYSEINMERAYEAVASGRMSVQKAAEEHGVPRSTLHDKVLGKVALKARSGTKKHLTNEEEAHLVDFLVGCASIGYAKSQLPNKLPVLEILTLKSQRVGGIPSEAGIPR